MKTLTFWYVSGGRIYPTREQAPKGAVIVGSLREALALVVGK